MKLSSFLSAFPRRAVIGLVWLASALFVLFISLVAVMYFWLLPNIGDYRDHLANLMSRALSQRMTVESVSGTWEQAHPQIRLRGVRLYDQQNRPALYLEELDAAFAWRSLWLFQPRFTHIELIAPAFTVRRTRDGNYYVGGIPVNPADPRSDFSDWLLKQGSVHVSRATLAWRDEIRGAPELVFRDLDLTLQNRFNRHKIEGHATPPAHLAGPIVLLADLQGRSVSDLKTWSGVVRSNVAGAALSRLHTWIDLPYTFSRGWGAGNIRLEIDRGRLIGAAAGVNVRDVTVTLASGLPALPLAHVRGSVDWKHAGPRQTLALQAQTLTLANGKTVPAFDAGLSWAGSAHEAHARNLNLTALQTVWPSLPLPLPLRDKLQDFQPRGSLDALQLRWQGEQPGAAGFNLAVRFRDVQLAARGARPGVSQLSGNVRGDEKSGVFALAGKAMQLDAPEVFRQALTLDTLQGRGTWKKRAQGVMLTLSQLDFANADAAGSAQGSYESVKNQAGRINVTAHLSRGKGAAVYRYMPRVIHQETVAWVQRAIIAGTASNTRLTLKGDLARFPFINDQGGIFKVEIDVHGATIDYVEGWPRIENANGRMLFQGGRMEVQATQARIFNTRLGPVTAMIPNLRDYETVLEISGQAIGDVQDFIQYANLTPIADKLEGLTQKMVGSGEVALALNLKIPLHHVPDTTLGGRLSFRGNTLSTAALPRLDQVKGEIVFTEHTLTTQGVNAQLLGGPVSVAISARRGRAQVQAQGRASASGLAGWLNQPWSSRLSGEARWRGNMVMEQAATQIRIESDLVGIESRLPAPLNKLAAQPMPLLITRLPQPGNEELIEVQLERTLGAIWQSTADKRISRGELRFGGVAKLPQEPGLRLVGNARGLALSEWLRVLPDDQGVADLPISAMDLSFGTLELMGRHFPDVRVQGRNRGGLLRLAVTGREMSGTLSYRPPDRTVAGSPARVSAQFKQLAIPAALPGAGPGTNSNMKASDMPVLDLSIEDFRLENQALGRLEAQAHGSAQGLIIDSLQLTHADSVVRMNGLWRDTGNGETQAKLQVEVFDAGKMLSRFGFKDAIKRGNVNIDGEVTWPGTPVDFGFQSLAGTMSIKAKNGQFLKVEPGVAKLLGVLSLQSLPRRLSFDFRDIFNDGFAFDEISATMLIARGVVYSEDLRMKGPAAKVAMSGLAKLSDETVQLRVKVTPKLSEGVAVAGALIGGPLAGLGVLAAQKLLRDPFEEASTREYMVIGPWREPDVTRIPKTGKQDATKDSDG